MISGSESHGQGQRDGEACMNMHESECGRFITLPHTSMAERKRETTNLLERPTLRIFDFSLSCFPLSRHFLNRGEPAFTFIYISVHLRHVDMSWTRHRSFSRYIYVYIFFILFFFNTHIKRKSWNPRSNFFG